MGKHRTPEPHEYPDFADTQRTSRRVLGLDHKYKESGPHLKAEHHYDFEDWWERYVTAPVEAANPQAETKIIPLIKNRPPARNELKDRGSSDDPNEVNMWKVFAYIIMGGLCAVLALYAVAALLAVIFLAIVVSAAWLGRKR